jgi:hypothetical protein
MLAGPGEGGWVRTARGDSSEAPEP